MRDFIYPDIDIVAGKYREGHSLPIRRNLRRGIATQRSSKCLNLILAVHPNQVGLSRRIALWEINK
jgi:hypothetical protein